MDLRFRGMLRGRKLHATDNLIISVARSSSTGYKISTIASRIRKRVDELNKEHSVFVKSMVQRGMFEIYIKLVKIEKLNDRMFFNYQINSIIKESKKC